MAQPITINVYCGRKNNEVLEMSKYPLQRELCIMDLNYEPAWWDIPILCNECKEA